MVCTYTCEISLSQYFRLNSENLSPTRTCVSTASEKSAIDCLEYLHFCCWSSFSMASLCFFGGTMELGAIIKYSCQSLACLASHCKSGADFQPTPGGAFTKGSKLRSPACTMYFSKGTIKSDTPMVGSAVTRDRVLLSILLAQLCATKMKILTTKNKLKKKTCPWIYCFKVFVLNFDPCVNEPHAW